MNNFKIDIDVELDNLLNETWNSAIYAAMKECTYSAKRQKGSVGARTCFEIKDAIFEHLGKRIKE
ncbi:MAG: hypothetical protein GY774_03565 [Planctomycetes bacterium]|nr:hypothetical protein [Planctomycetota bacterium]